jgi:hypothetical protein
MKTKYGVALLGVLLVILAVVSPAGAYYSNVIGELRDDKNHDLWAYGAAVEVYNCLTLQTINTTTVPLAPNPGYGVFNVDVSMVSADTSLCIEVVFYPGPDGTPGNAAKGPYLDRSTNSGTLNTGVYFTGTGPTAVVLKSLAVSPSADSTMMMSLIGLSLMVAVGFAILIRKKFA